MDRDKLIKIITAGTYAPSGDNSQPWKFIVRENQIDVFNLPDKDNLYYNFRQYGSLVAHGSLIENISIAASTMGYKADVNLFPDQENVNLIVRMTLYQAEIKPDDLYLYIEKRVTNRKPYKNKIPLNSEQRQLIKAMASGNNQAEVYLIENPGQLKIIGQAVSINEIVALENKMLHNLFFKDIVWSEKEERTKKSGLYLKTFELPLPIQFLFRLIRHWPVANFLNKLGFAKTAAKGNAKIYSSGSAIGVVVVKSNGTSDYVIAGRLMQRVWLTATKLGLSLQPITGVLFLMQRILTDKASELKPTHIALLKNAYSKIKNIFNIDNETIAMLFRVGYADEPSARCSRLPPNIKFESSHSQN